MTTVGTGNFTYELVQDWPKLPEGWTFGTTSAVATDSQDRVYVFQRHDPPVVVFDSDGLYLSSWGSGIFSDPHGIFIEDDVVYVSDRSDHVVLKFTLEGQHLLTIGNRGVHSDTGCDKPGDLAPRAAGPFNYPTELAPSPSGDLYVSDGYRNSRVHRFNSQGELVSSWGEPGGSHYGPVIEGRIEEGPNRFRLLHSILVDRDGKVYVCDRENSRIQIFSPDGRFLTMWTDIHRPTDIATDVDGNFYISEFEDEGVSTRLSILDADGQALARLESRAAHGLWVDSRGDIYIAANRNRSIDKYVRKRSGI